MESMFKEIYDALVSGHELSVATIIRDGGSTPRTAGSRMIVYNKGITSGSIGGGAIEGDVIQRCMRCLKTHEPELVFIDLGRRADTHQLDLICGGRMQILIEHVPCHADHIGLYNLARTETANFRPFNWITRIKDSQGKVQVEHAIQKADNEFVGAPRIQQEIRAFIESGMCTADGSRFFEDKGHSYVIESIRPPHTIYLFGAGHVSKEIAGLSKHVGFRIIVFDDRAEFANVDRFPDADKICVCPEYAKLFKNVDTGQDDYVIIVTRGHSFDKVVLEQALKTKAGYIGMIGSRKKRDTIYKELIKLGIKPSTLDKVYCPIGLAIDAETPAEIAVSVVAQLIQHRAKQKKQ